MLNDENQRDEKSQLNLFYMNRIYLKKVWKYINFID